MISARATSRTFAGPPALVLRLRTNLTYFASGAVR
jgi:hypothetical protein